MANAAYGFELRLDVDDAHIDLAAVSLKLRLTRTTRADPAAKLRHGAAASCKPGQLVFKLRQLHLQLAFACLRMASEDVENQLRAVDHVAGKPRLDIAQLRRRQVMVEEDQRSIGRRHHLNDLVELALADEARWIRLLAALHQRGRNRCTGRTRKLLELGTARVEVQAGRGGLGKLLISRRDRGRVTRKPRGGGELLAFAQLAGELDDDDDGKLLLRLRGAQLARKECGVLGLARLNEASADGFAAFAARTFFVRGDFRLNFFGGLFAGQWISLRGVCPQLMIRRVGDQQRRASVHEYAAITSNFHGVLW